MGTGYVRQSAADIIAGNAIEAGPLNAEFNQLRDAFHETSGHAHDGTTGEGPQISLTTSVTGVLPASSGGTGGIHKLDATTAPTANDDTGDGYAVGSLWVDITNDRVYVAVDVTLAAAVWRYVGSVAGTALNSLTPAADKLPYFTSTTAAALADITAFGRSLIDDAAASNARTTLGVVIGTDVLAYDAGIQNLAGVAFAANKSVYWTADNVAASYDLSTFARTILDDADASAVRTTLGLAIGTDVQAYDADLTAIAALAGTNTIYYRSAANTWSAVTIGGNLTFTGGTLDAVASSLDATLTAMAGVVTAADKAIYFTGVDTAAAYDLSSFARTLLDDADAATARTTLGLTIGTDVQAYDADLAAVAGLSSNGLIARTGAGTAAARTLTAPAAGITVSNGDGVSGNPTLDLANDLAALEALSGTNTLYYRSAADTWSAVTIGSGLSFSSGTLDAASSSSSGTYTPTVTLSTNAASATAGVCIYARSGDIVNVSGLISLDSTASGVCVVEITLPIASNFGATTDASGVVGAEAGGVAGVVTASVANDRLVISADNNSSGGADPYRFMCQYRVI